MRTGCAIIAAVLMIAGGSRAMAIDLDVFHPPDFTLQFRPYGGIGVSRVHHTGYDPGRTVSLERWEIGGKAYAGAQIMRWAAVEAAYHYLNSSPFFGRSPSGTSVIIVPGHERSQAVAVSFLAFTKPLFTFWFPFKLYGRLGGAYKDISHDNGAGLVQREDGFAFLIGGGGEFEIGRHWFARIEYEYLSKIGTSRVVNVQHTPISFSLGAKY
jgi:opacity protein-like surface antigen